MKRINRRDLIRIGFIGAFLYPATNAHSSTFFIRNNKTLMALIDTIVPGATLDPTGAPGGVEANTLLYLQKVEREKLLPLPFGLIKNLISGGINILSILRYQVSFHKLPLNKREKVARSLERIPGVHLFYKVLRAPFYTGSMNKVGFKYLGYPGPNNGYRDFSFNKKMAEPHPRSIRGNLP